MKTAALKQPPLVIGAVGMIPRFKLKADGPIIVRIRNEMREAMLANGYLTSAPFQTVNLIFRYERIDNPEPVEYKVVKSTKSLEIATEFEAQALQSLTEQQLEEKFRTALIEVLCDVAANFDLPYDFLDDMRGKKFH